MEANMRWLKSTSQKSWVINGKVIPQCVTPHNDYLKIDDSEYNEMHKRPVFASLERNGCILVLAEEPAELKNSVEALQGDKAALIATNTVQAETIKQLEEQLKQSKAVDVAVIKAEAEADKQKALQELDEKASGIIADKDREIAELKAQLQRAEAAKGSKSKSKPSEE